MSMIENQQAQRTERLTDAFRLFNQLSENLNASYQGLEAQVAKLNRELVAARSERLTTLIEKEKIAARLQQILAALPAAVIVLDGSERVIDCNCQALDFLGEPLVGQPWRQLMQERLAMVSDTPHERRLQDGRRINLRANRLANESGQIILLSDVTELRSLQEMLSRQKHLTAMGEMVAGLAHQVRTPLATAILYTSQINKADLSDEKRRRFSEKILERLHHLERQVNDMLNFAKQGRLSMEEFSLTELLSKVADQMADMSVEFVLENQVDVDAMLGNEDALRGAVMNILNNAVDACDGNGRIEMTVFRHDDCSLCIQIEDNGSGMDESQRQRLFEPFFSTKAHGTGLGLAVVDSIVRAHSGTIECLSTPQVGTRFTLVLPCINQYTVSFSTVQVANEDEIAYERV